MLNQIEKQRERAEYHLTRQYGQKSMFLTQQEKQLQGVVHLVYQVLWESAKQAIQWLIKNIIILCCMHKNVLAAAKRHLRKPTITNQYQDVTQFETADTWALCGRLEKWREGKGRRENELIVLKDRR